MLRWPIGGGRRAASIIIISQRMLAIMNRVESDFKSEVRDGMRIDWDVPVEMDDGIVLRADVYRPAKIFGGKVTLHTSPDKPAYVLLPIIPKG